MEDEKERVYCSKCLRWQRCDSIVRAKREFDRGYKIVQPERLGDGFCDKVMDTYSTPVRLVKVCRDLAVLNANNDCPHYEAKLESSAKLAAAYCTIPEPKRPWWKFWRSKGE